MAKTILNPARFTTDPLGSRNYIRAAFFDEGYGVSTSFKAYVQGGSIVPASSAFNAIGAGTVGDPLRMSQFNGFVVPSLVNITDQSIVASGAGFDQASATVEYSLLSNGTARTLRIGDFLYEDIAIPGEWLVGGTTASDFSVRATAQVYNVGGDSYFNGTLNTWESLSSTRAWSLAVDTRNSSAQASVILLVQIARTSNTSAILDSAEIGLQVDAQTAQ